MKEKRSEKEVKKKDKMRYKKGLLISTIFLVLLMLLLIPIRADTCSCNDPKDDVYCFTEDQLDEFTDDFEEPEDGQDFYDMIIDMLDEGVKSSEPDCIDMTKVETEDTGSMIELTITVEGDVGDCELIMILIWGNCSGDDSFFGWASIYTGDGGSDPVGEFIFYLEDDHDDNETGSLDISSDGSEIGMEYPDNWWDEEECALYIVMISYCEDEELVCLDIFPNEGWMEDKQFAEGYIGWDPVTQFFDYISSILFWFMCGKTAFFLLMACLIIAAKVLIDRRKRFLHWTGFALFIPIMWSLFWFTLNTDLLATDPVLDFPIMSYLELFIGISFISFCIISYVNSFKMMDDNEWLYVLGFSLIMVESLLYIFPMYFYYCGGQPTLALIVLSLLLVFSILSLFLTEKYGYIN